MDSTDADWLKIDQQWSENRHSEASIGPEANSSGFSPDFECHVSGFGNRHDQCDPLLLGTWSQQGVCCCVVKTPANYFEILFLSDDKGVFGIIL
ncbi:hypothetical protein CEXT_803131 [Caerostris extrusa]|uniref:Uncharacterized protein n=1 Tax=Caerostris extrusa TaxID=172846 RepID=A0AAV4RAP4_CAEEX|nr:hypothetical protein CEXT_803131 [Caerostris extrusa]